MLQPFDDFHSRLIQAGYHPEDVELACYMGISSLDAFWTLLEDIKTCTACPLHQGCTQPVPGSGPLTSPIVLVGEGPGEDEDDLGIPFIGISGMLLTLVLSKMGIDRRKIYLTNVLKCRPEGNRTPTPEEAQTCSSHHLYNEIDLIRPKVILTLGNVAMTALRPQESNLRITKERGVWQDYHGIPMLHTYHPSYLLRRTGDDLRKAKLQFWQDLQIAFAKTEELLRQEGRSPDYILLGKKPDFTSPNIVFLLDDEDIAHHA